MRVMLVRPGCHFSVADVHRGWLNAFRELGCDVVDINLDDRLTCYDKWQRLDPQTSGQTDTERANATVRYAAHTVRADVFDVWPDLLMVVSGFYLPDDFYQVIRARGIKTALLCTESPYEDDRQIHRAPLVDLVLVNDPTNLERFRDVNPNTHYIPHAYDPAIHYPGPFTETDKSDFCFVGTGYPSRVEFFEQVDWSGIDVAFAGNWQALTPDSPLLPFLAHEQEFCLSNEDAVSLYRGTKVSANLYRKETTDGGTADGWACGPREIELAACGTFFLREPRGESDSLFPFLPTFSDAEEFQGLLRHYLARPDTRVALAEKARGAVSERTFVNHAREALALL